MPALGGIIANETGDTVPGTKTFPAAPGNFFSFVYADPRLPAGDYLIAGYSFALSFTVVNTASPSYSAALYLATGGASGISGPVALDSVVGETGVEALFSTGGTPNWVYLPATTHRASFSQPLRVSFTGPWGFFVKVQSRNGVFFNNPFTLTYQLQLSPA